MSLFVVFVHQRSVIRFFRSTIKKDCCETCDILDDGLRHDPRAAFSPAKLDNLHAERRIMTNEGSHEGCGSA